MVKKNLKKIIFLILYIVLSIFAAKIWITYSGNPSSGSILERIVVYVHSLATLVAIYIIIVLCKNIPLFQKLMNFIRSNLNKQ